MPMNMPSTVTDHDTTPSSSRPSSAASTCASGGPPNRTASMDSLYTSASSTTTEKGSTLGQEYIPTRINRTAPKINTQAMQFVKVGPAELYKSATEQIKKVEQVKAMRKQLITEEEDWQQNLDKWKSSRRKRNEGALERVIEVKKNEQDEEFQKRRRKSKTFNEMMDDKSKRGRRYNLVVHDDDNDDLGDLGLSTGGAESNTGDTIEPLKPESNNKDSKDIYNDKDAKSDAGFCTGSDTGSDGVFAEDNISDTSSALGDKKEAHDSLLDCGVSKEEESHINGGDASTSSTITSSSSSTLMSRNSSLTSSSKNDYSEYTYDKAIQSYKEFAESTTKKRTTANITSLTSAIYDNGDCKSQALRENRSPSPSKGQKIGEKLNFFNREIEREHSKTSETTTACVRRENSPKVDITKRRSMFELREPADNSNSSHYSSTKSLYQPRKLSDTAGSLKSKVASFENLDSDCGKYKGVTPPRDTKFKEKLANFSQKDTSPDPSQIRKKTPERDQTFHQKLASFSSMEKGESEKKVENKTKPMRDPSLKNKIASFEQLDQADNDISFYRKDRAVSMESLNKSSNSEVKIQSSVSMGNLNAKIPTTPYMVVHLEDQYLEEEPVVCAERPTLNLDSFNQALTLDDTHDNMVDNNVSKYSNGHEVRADASSLHSTSHTKSFSNIETSRSEERLGKEAANNFEADNNEYYDDIEPVPANNYHNNEKEEAIPPLEENIYENISEEPVYENIYEKVNEDSPYLKEQDTDHYYQTLDDAKEDKHNLMTTQSLASDLTRSTENTGIRQEPPLPSTTSSSSLPQVYDVTWTEDSATPRVPPPSEPPPPPPPDDEGTDASSDESDGRHYSRTNDQQQGSFDNSQSGCYGKEELLRRRSAFLGTSPVPATEEPTIKPPPDLSELLREECEADRKMKEKMNQALLDEKEVLRREREIIESLEREEEQRLRYMWDDRMKEEEEETSDLKDLLQYNDGFINNTAKQSSSHLSSISDTSSLTTSNKSSNNNKPLLKSSTTDNFQQSNSRTSSSSNGTTESLDKLAFGLQQTEKFISSSSRDKMNFRKHVVNTNLDDYYNKERTTYPNNNITEPVKTPEPTTDAMPTSSDIVDSAYVVEMASKPAAQIVEQTDLDVESVTTTNNNKVVDCDNMQTLAQLEMEMVQHDKEMLQRSNLTMPSLQDHSSLTDSLPKTSETSTPAYSPRDYETPYTPSSLPTQEFYTAPTYQGSQSSNSQDYASTMQSSFLYHHNTTKTPPSRGSPSQYTSLASPHPFVNSHSSSSLVSSASSYSSASPRDEVMPEPLPRRKKAPPPVPEKSHESTERLDALRASKSGGYPDGTKDRSNYDQIIDTSSSNMTKKTLAALSAIPKPRLADNDSWIKKKPEGKRDYSKHWLIHEAEQRRIEQHQRQERGKQIGQGQGPNSLGFNTDHNNSTSTPSSVQSSLSHLQTHTTYNQYNNNNNNTADTLHSSSSYNSAISYNTTSTSTVSYSNNNTNNNNNINNISSTRRDHATTTYQPRQPSSQSNGDKPLPDSIINTLTQRVNNKNKNNSIINGKHSGYNNNYSGDENYHDYMNADALAATMPGHGGYQNNTSPNQAPAVSQSSEEQRLLSVSGKKKCSLCGEELGRGAAMIIESLRLFYHIPCFKCCVCGIQLGNGKAGADVRVRNHKLHCHNCYSTKEGMKFSKV